MKKTPLRRKSPLRQKKPLKQRMSIKDMLAGGLITKASEIKPRKKLRQRSPSNPGWYDVALEIWAERPHVCCVTGMYLSEEPEPSYFSHLLPRGSYRKYKRDKRNIVLMHPDIHAMWHAEGPEKLINIRQWKPVCELYLQLRNEANGIL